MNYKERVENIQKVREIVQEASTLFEDTIEGTAVRDCLERDTFKHLLNQGDQPWETGLDQIEEFFLRIHKGVINE